MRDAIGSGASRRLVVQGVIGVAAGALAAAPAVAAEPAAGSSPVTDQPTLDLAAINALEPRTFVDRLGGVFEHAAWVAEEALPARPFASVDALHAAMIAVVRQAPAARRLAFLNGHPELAGPEARARSMTADSASEQGSADLDRMPPADAERFDRLNLAYRQKFGFPFIIAVRGRGRAEILAVFEARLARGQAEEEAQALAEIAAITRMRLDQLVSERGG